MATGASEDLSERLDEILERVEAGEDASVRVDGRDVARATQVSRQPRWVSKGAFFADLRRVEADAAVHAELDGLAPDTTDDLGPLSMRVARVRMIAAMSADRVIGTKDGLPWDVPADYEHFVASVRGGAVVMGRRSYEIFGGDLEDVLAIVLTRSEHAPAGSRRAGDVEAALADAAASGRAVWVAGGASVYAQVLPYADELHLSIVPGEFEGDAWFPAWDEESWVLAEEDPREGYAFRRYERIVHDLP